MHRFKNSITGHAKNPFIKACFDGDLEKVKKLVNDGFKYKKHLEYACAKSINNPDVTLYLITELKSTALNSALDQCVFSGDSENFEKLLAFVTVNDMTNPDCNGWRLLLTAAERAREYNFLEKLIRCGYNLHREDDPKALKVFSKYLGEEIKSSNYDNMLSERATGTNNVVGLQLLYEKSNDLVNVNKCVIISTKYCKLDTFNYLISLNPSIEMNVYL